MNRKLLAVPVMAAAALLAGGCSHLHNGSGSAAASSAGQSARAFASSSQGKEDIATGKAIVRACVPKSTITHPLAQLTWAREMVKHDTSGSETRQAFASCAGIPKSKQKAFEQTALNDTKAAVKAAATAKLHHQKASTPIVNLLEVTLPKLVVDTRG